MINIRHHLTPKMLVHGGHIRYGIRPTERRKGYNKINLYDIINEYLKVRPNLNKAYPDRNALFLSNRKQRISKRNVQDIIKNELNSTFTDSEDKYHTHTLRHTGATLMYDENNTDILIIKEILGHKSISSTEIYTHVDNKRLRELMQNFNVLDLGGNKNE